MTTYYDPDNPLGHPDGLVCEDCLEVMDELGGYYECPDCGSYSYLDVKDHVRFNRWPARSHEPTLTPEVAWFQGFKVHEADAELHGMVGDEFRYHHPSRVVLLRRDVALATVIEVPTAREGIQEAVISALVYHTAEPKVIAEIAQDVNLTRERLRELARRSRTLDEMVSAEPGNGPGTTGTNAPVGTKTSN